MIKLITPPGMLFTTALLAIYSAYAAWTALVERSSLHALFAVLAVAACIGTALMRPWSRHLVYLLTAAFSAAWFVSVYEGIRVGYFEFAYSSQLAIARALAPGLLMVALSGICSYLVLRHFRATAALDGGSQNREIS